LGNQIGEHAYERGVRELRAFAAVSSSYLVRVFDAVLEDTFVYAMEYFPMGSLASPARPLSKTLVLRAMRHAALATHALHEAGLAHGDIKPANIMLHEDGAKLSDLGLARVLTPGTTLTSMGGARDLEFIDPALLQGERPSRKSEIWTLGASLHRALTGIGLYGELPDNQPVLAIRRLISTKPEIDESLTPAEAKLIRDCLGASSLRPRTAKEVADRLAELEEAAD
jgi:eukaryotic-like serine/threonine-protein kinase